jgi:hypothetical protein
VKNEIYAERLLEGIQRQASISVSEDFADGIRSLNEMIGMISSNDPEGGDLPPVLEPDDPNETDPGSIGAELDALKESVRLRDPQRVEDLLDKARKKRSGRPARKPAAAPKRAEPAGDANAGRALPWQETVGAGAYRLGGILARWAASISLVGG